MVQSFNYFDLDENGLISFDELAQILRKENPDITDEIIEYMMAEVDTDHDGNISFEEFIEAMKIKFEEDEIQSQTYEEYQDKGEVTNLSALSSPAYPVSTKMSASYKQPQTHF